MPGSADLGTVCLWYGIVVLKLTFHSSGVLGTDHKC